MPRGGANPQTHRPLVFEPVGPRRSEGRFVRCRFRAETIALSIAGKEHIIDAAVSAGNLDAGGL